MLLTVVFGVAIDHAVGDQMQDLAARVGVRVLAPGTSDARTLRAATARIPYEKMSARSRQRAAKIVEQLSQYRRMPSLQYEVDPDIYLYLMRNPDAAVSTWRVMGISQLQMTQAGTFEYRASAIDGSVGIADVLWRDHHQCLFIAEGMYNSPLLPASINASALVWLQFRFVKTDDGRTVVNQQVETFIYFPSAAIEAIAKVASRLTNTILDRNVFEVSLYARMMSQAARRDPDWLSEVAARMDGVPAQRRSELIQLASRYQGPNTDAAMAPFRKPQDSGPVTGPMNLGVSYSNAVPASNLSSSPAGAVFVMRAPLPPVQVRAQSTAPETRSVDDQPVRDGNSELPGRPHNSSEPATQSTTIAQQQSRIVEPSARLARSAQAVAQVPPGPATAEVPMSKSGTPTASRPLRESSDRKDSAVARNAGAERQSRSETTAESNLPPAVESQLPGLCD